MSESFFRCQSVMDILTSRRHSAARYDALRTYRLVTAVLIWVCFFSQRHAWVPYFDDGAFLTLSIPLPHPQSLNIAFGCKY